MLLHFQNYINYILSIINPVTKNNANTETHKSMLPVELIPIHYQSMKTLSKFNNFISNTQ